MIIRKYRDKDKKQVLKLVKDVLYEIFKQKPSGLEDLDNIKKYYDSFYIAEDKGKVIGTIGLKKNRLHRLYLRKKYRGKGVSMLILNKVIKYCKGKYNEIILTTSSKFKRAVKFYKKNKFKEFKREKGVIWFKRKLK